MKTLYGVAVVTVVMLAGCGEKSKPAPPAAGTNAAGGSPLTAPVDYLNSINKGQKSAVKTVDTAALNQAIQLFSVDRGRNPRDLEELVREKYIPQLPTAPYGMKIVYDAANGSVSVVKQ